MLYAIAAKTLQRRRAVQDFSHSVTCSTSNRPRRRAVHSYITASFGTRKALDHNPGARSGAPETASPASSAAARRATMKAAWAPRRRTWLLVERTSGAATSAAPVPWPRRASAARPAGPGRDAGRAPARRRRRAAARARAAGHREAHRGPSTCAWKAKPDSTLSATERARIRTVVGKYAYTPEFVLGRVDEEGAAGAMWALAPSGKHGPRAAASSPRAVSLRPPAFRRAHAARRGGLGAPELAAAALRARMLRRAPPAAIHWSEEVLEESFFAGFFFVFFFFFEEWRSFMASSAPAKASTRPWWPNAGLGSCPCAGHAANWASTVASAPRPTLSPRFLCSTWLVGALLVLAETLALGPAHGRHEACATRRSRRRRLRGAGGLFILFGLLVASRVVSDRAAVRCALLSSCSSLQRCVGA